MSFLPARQNFKVPIGETFRYRFQWLIQADNTDTPQNLTGFHGSMPIVSLDGLTAYQTLTTENGGLIFSGATGFIEILLSKAQTEALGWTVANYTLSVTNPLAESFPLLKGRLKAL